MSNTPLYRQIEEHDNGWYYIGPLSEGKAEAHADRFVTEFPNEHGGVTVELGELLGAAPGATAEFGSGLDSETAWRYALGAFYGPLEDLS